MNFEQFYSESDNL